MNHKVLLADDSLTIQKVIKITLANEPYDITECSNEEELFNKLPDSDAKIIFLDFNLSDRYTGYELTSKIKSICPGAKVLLLFGTFDAIDDSAIQKCGASDKIIKPFDSNKFIAICKHFINLTEDFDSGNDHMEMPVSKVKSPEDQWQMNNSAMKIVENESLDEPITEEALKSPTNNLDALNKEITDWGMSVPNIINDEETSHEIRFDLPPVIEEVESAFIKLDPVTSHDNQIYQEATVMFPDDNDLDYPFAPESEPKTRQPAKLVSIENFTEEAIELELEGNYVEDAADVSKIEDQIKDEVDENLWQADEFEDLKREVSAKIEEMSSSESNSDPKNLFDESHFKPLDEGESIEWTGPKADVVKESRFSATEVNINRDDLLIEIETMVKKHVKEYLDQMFHENVEKVTWEVIPDLAENLIRQELSKISKKIINDQD
jgi:DNA-binding response OmpR family regulator